MRPRSGVAPAPVLALALVLAVILALVLGPGAAGPAQAFEDRGAHVVVDAATGRVLDARKPNHPRFPASLTKMMTVLMLFRALDAGTLTPQTEIAVSTTAAAANPVKLGLAAGETITVAEAIPALIARSSNDVAVAVAEHLAGTEALFAHEMTRVARSELGMTRTTFRNASGLPDDEHVTTPLDMARLAQALWRDHRGRFDVFATDVFRFRGRALPTYNPLLTSYDGADGLKTGFTCAAGYNLAGTAVQDGRRIIAVVMGAASSADRLVTIERVMDEGFAALAPSDPAAAEVEATAAGVAPSGAGAGADAGDSAGDGEGAARPPPVVADLVSLDSRGAPRPLRRRGAPDVEGCGGLYTGGWAVTLGAFRGRGHARNLAARGARAYGGKPLTAPVGTGGMVRHHAYVAALSAGQARAVCRQRRARGQYCLVKSPKMMWAAMEAVTRLRRSMR